MTTISVDDYLVLRAKSETASNPKKARYVVAKTTKVNGSNILARLEVLPHWKPSMVQVTKEEVAINLGSSPPPGKVYGCDLTQLYVKTVQHPDFGDVHFMCRPNKDDRQKLSRAMTSVAQNLRKNKLGFLLEEGTLIEVVNHTFTKYSGMFYCSKDREKHPSRLVVCADSQALQVSGIDNYEYVLAHELGHALHFHHLKSIPAIDSAWVKAYSNSVRPKIVEASVAEKFLHLLKTERNVSGAMGQMEEDHQEAGRLILKWIKLTGGFGAQEINLLLETDRDDLLEGVWPGWELVLRDLQPKLTLYSTKNYKELFAESFAYWLTEQMLPPKLNKLLERSIQVARG